MQKLTLKQKFKETLTKTKANLRKSSDTLKQKISNANITMKKSTAKIENRAKTITIPKLILTPKKKTLDPAASNKTKSLSKIFSSRKKKKPESEPTPVAKNLGKGAKIIDKYPLYEPFAQVAIIQDPKTGEHKYILDELQLDPMERGIYNRILEILLAEISSPKEEITDPRKFFALEAKKIIDKYRISLGWLPDVSWYKILYHAERDLVGFGKIDPLMRDPNIEDISCDGVSKSVYIWHRVFESIETNLQFESDESLDNLVVKLVHMAGKHVSSAFPIVDASLPGKHRLAVAYRREITPFGTAFTIRKFREDPYSIIDLINIGTFTEEMAAYLWVCLENRASVMVLGGTAAGKTTALNALGCLVKPGSKIMTIEETAELNLSHENWVSLIARQSYGLGGSSVGEVALFDLVKTCMRHRPDLMIVGEVRGQEAYVLFQALATGHGGMCTMHAENVQSAVRRLTQKPMDISPAYIPLMNIVMSVQRVHLVKNGQKKAYRRVLSVNEIIDSEKFVESFKWDPIKDEQTIDLDHSFLLKNFSERLGITLEQLTEEMNRRTEVLSWMRKSNIRSYKEVASIIAEYYARPKEFYSKIVASEEAKPVAISDKFEALSFRLFGRFAPYFLRKVFPQIKGALEKGRVKIYSETYVSLMLLVAILTLPVSILAASVALLYGILPLLILVPLPLFIIAGFLVVPMNNASERSQGLEREMPFAAAYISVMSSGGIAPYSSFKRLTQVNLMPAMRKEAQDIIKDVEIFGVDPLSALDIASKKTPLDIFKDFLGGYASTVIIGGDIGHYLERKAEDIFRARALRVKAAAERLGMLLETFIIVMVMMSLCFYILFAVNGIQSGANASSDISQYSGILLYTYIFTPMLSMLFIYLAHSMQPKTPLVDMRPYKVFAVCGVLGVVVFLLLTNFMGALQLPLFSNLQTLGVDLPVAIAVALFISAAPAAIVHMRLTKAKTSMEQGVANFLRDLTEVRKTGLSPEKCIESLSKRDYGTFTKELRKISSEISWGIPIKNVMMDFLHRTRSWMVQIVMFLLVETIDVGGGTIPMIESLARFNNLTQEVEKEKKMSVRPYVMMPYLASILLVATTVMMMGLTTGIAVPGATAAPKDNGLMQTVFMSAVIFNSYLIGIVAGKISEESVGAGFKHAAILVLISVIAAKVIPQFIKLG